ncbi:uncharacterized protein LOC125942081 [Dermacentor silvarum]|uniref:uncharacterized protein LOC125942081 n=1 Tax=Dermacentor silvarum TaxID=543639 RepID=UPI0021015DAA|nr:uncharacterized protein LOC125942081 [Dermacentor silvarum]
MKFNFTFDSLGGGQFLLKCSESSEQVACVKAEAAGSIKTAGATRTEGAPEDTGTARPTDTARATETAQETESGGPTSTVWDKYGIGAYKNAEIAKDAETTESTNSDELEQIIIKAMTSPMPTIGHVNSPPLFMSKNQYPQVDNLQVGKHYVVYVSQIYNVHHFYIQRKDTNALVRLEALMNKVYSVYNGPQSYDYFVDEKLVYVGMPCAASYTYNESNSDWHRA